MLKIKDKDFLNFQLNKRKEYNELRDFIRTSQDLKIIIKKQHICLDGIFTEKRKMRISQYILDDILEKLIEKEDKCIDVYLNSCCIEKVE